MSRRRVAVRIAYLGKHFSGSQAQPDKYTVAGQIASDLGMINPGRSDEWNDLKIASRTDAGVNAVGNVAAFYTEIEDNGSVLRALNGVTRNVFYTAIADVDDGFRPRHANLRVYRYTVIENGLDIEAMRECAGVFIGEHDFANFCRYDGKPTVTDLRKITLHEEGRALAIGYESRFFLWNMIRRISAALIKVGRGEATVDEVRCALEGEERTFGVGRPDALTLMDVVYDGLEFTPYDSKPFTRRRQDRIVSAELEAGFYRMI